MFILCMYVYISAHTQTCTSIHSYSHSHISSWMQNSNIFLCPQNRNKNCMYLAIHIYTRYGEILNIQNVTVYCLLKFCKIRNKKWWWCKSTKYLAYTPQSKKKKKIKPLTENYIDGKMKTGSHRPELKL